MIFYFSGTGNSRFVAERLAAWLEERLCFIPATDPVSMQPEGKSMGIVSPIYSWGIPPIVLDFIKKIPAETVIEMKRRNLKVWYVCTCGDDTGEAPAMIEKCLNEKGLALAGVWSVQMPNNYVLLPGFDTDPKELEAKKLAAAPMRIKVISDKIKDGKWERDFVSGSMPGLKTGLVYPLFKRWGIFPEKWKSTDSCIGCGKCGKVCPVGNITMEEGRPKWGKECCSCLACYHVCPVNAVQYGSLTKHKGQYFLVNS